MSNKKVDLREQLRAHKFEFELLQKIACTKEENKKYEKMLKENQALPEGVYPYVYADGEVSTKEFYTIYEPDLTEAEIQEYLTYKQLSLIRTIKNCVVFFTVITIIGMLCSFLMFANF